METLKNKIQNIKNNISNTRNKYELKKLYSELEKTHNDMNKLIYDYANVIRVLKSLNLKPLKYRKTAIKGYNVPISGNYQFTKGEYSHFYVEKHLVAQVVTALINANINCEASSNKGYINLKGNLQ